MEERLWNGNYIKIWAGNFLMHFSFTLIVPLLPLYLSETFGAGKDTIGLVLAGYTVMALLVRPFSGFMVDRFPRRAVLLICNFLFFALFTGYLAAGSLTMFALFRTLHGAPFGASTVAASTVAIDVLPSSRRTEGIGYYGLSSNLAEHNQRGTANSSILTAWDAGVGLGVLAGGLIAEHLGYLSFSIFCTKKSVSRPWAWRDGHGGALSA